MLSADMQKLILRIYYNYATTSNKSVPYNDLKDLYKSKISFKRAINYLVKCNFIHKNIIEYSKVEYSLTLSGELLARILCSLPDAPPEYKEVQKKFIL